jgi:hypothetical protein
LKFNFLFTFSLFILSNTLYSQINLDDNFISKEKIGLHVGTFTNEFQYKKKISKHFISSFAIGYSNYTLIADVNLNNNNNIFKLNTDIRSFKSSFEYIPSNFSNLTFFTGLSYFSKFDIKAEVSLKDNIKFGDIALKPDVAGNIFSTIDYSGFSPFVGLSHHTFIGERLSFESKLTFNYFSNPKVLEYGGTNIFNYNYQNQYQFQNLINQFKVLPSLNFGLNYLIK